MFEIVKSRSTLRVEPRDSKRKEGQREETKYRKSYLQVGLYQGAGKR